jgi:hypothetical protein
MFSAQDFKNKVFAVRKAGVDKKYLLEYDHGLHAMSGAAFHFQVTPTLNVDNDAPKYLYFPVKQFDVQTARGGKRGKYGRL